MDTWNITNPVCVVHCHVNSQNHTPNLNSLIGFLDNMVPVFFEEEHLYDLMLG